MLFLNLYLNNNMKPHLLFTSLIFTFFSCAKKNDTEKKLVHSFIDSIIKHSDSSYQKLYYRTDFVTACYYINKKDSTLSQFMKDSAGNIRQVIVTKKDTRIFFAQYYPNGKAQADLPLDSFGQFNGTGKFFYKDGNLQSAGNYKHGFKTGDWKVYDEKGKITATDSYDDNGNLIPQKAP
jgi:antitoxin component YwqK of YwqJK toxin-antitoxin module